MNEIVKKYFPSLGRTREEQFSRLEAIYSEWNARINVISRKDFKNFWLHHVLHSLAIARIIDFIPGTRIIDVGTGGGFPGIPLAIMFPSSGFFLLDSIEKKIRVVREVAAELGLQNVKTIRIRAEEEKGKYDFALGRAVTTFPEFVRLTRKNIGPDSKNSLKNGIICLKGGDLKSELLMFKGKIITWDINSFFPEPYFEEKKIIYLSV